MQRLKLNWNLTYKYGAALMPGINNQSAFKAYYAEEKDIRTFYVISPNSDIADFQKLQALKINKIKNDTIKVSCDEPQLWSLFEKIFVEIFELMKVDHVNFHVAYNSIIGKYSTFLEEMKFLGKEKQIGLLAELLFLEQLLLIDKNTLFFWIDSSEDFKIRNKYVEIKATRSKLHKHIINGLSQLTVLPNTQKYLVSYLVEDNESEQTLSSINLQTQTNKILSLLDVNQGRNFKEKLINRNYWHDIQGNEFQQFNFTFNDPIYAEITLAFPKLDIHSIPSQLHGNIPPDQVRYELNLQSILNLFTPLNRKNIEGDFYSN